jgi:hypothetical protein
VLSTSRSCSVGAAAFRKSTGALIDPEIRGAPDQGVDFYRSNVLSTR